MINLDRKMDECLICLETDKLTNLMMFNQIVSDCKCRAFYHNLCLHEWIRHNGHKKCMICKKIGKNDTFCIMGADDIDNYYAPYHCFLDNVMNFAMVCLDFVIMRIVDMMLCPDPQNLSNINQMVYQLYAFVRNIICSILIIAIYLKVTLVVAILCILWCLQICTINLLSFGVNHSVVIISSIFVGVILEVNDYFGYILFGDEF